MPDVRDADELHDLLQTLVIFPVPVTLHPNKPQAGLSGTPFGGWELLDLKWKPEMMALEANRRAVTHTSMGGSMGRFRAHAGVSCNFLRPTSSQSRQLLAKEVVVEHALDRALLGWLGILGPGHGYGVARNSRVWSCWRSRRRCCVWKRRDRSCAATSAAAHCRRCPDKAREATVEEGLEWCDRRLLARIHRLSDGPRFASR